MRRAFTGAALAGGARRHATRMAYHGERAKGGCCQKAYQGDQKCCQKAYHGDR